MVKSITQTIIIIYGIILTVAPFVLSAVEFVSRTQVLCMSYMLVLVLSVISMIKITMYQNVVKITTVDVFVLSFMLYQGFNIMRLPNMSSDTVNTYMYLTILILYIHSRNTLDGRNTMIFQWMIVFISLSQILFGLMCQTNNFSSIRHIHGTFFNPGLLAGFISLAIISLVNLFYNNFRQNNLWHLKLILYIIVLAILIYIVLRLNSRAALMASGCGVIMVFCQLFQPKLKILLAAILILVLAGCYLYCLKPESANGRILVWLSSVEMVKDSPILGLGTGAFRQNYMNYQAQYLTTTSCDSFNNLASDTNLAFNELLKILVEQGIVGGVLFIGLLASVLKIKNVGFRHEIVSLKALLCAMLMFGMFSYPTESILFQTVFVITVAQLAGLADTQHAVVIKINRKTTTALCVLAVVVYIPVGISVFTYMDSCKKLDKIILRDVTDRQTVAGLQELYPRLFTTNEYLSYYGQILNQLKEYRHAELVLEQQGRCFPSSRQRIDLGIALHSQGRYREADEKWIEASKMVPALIKPHYLLAKSYFLQGKKQLGYQQAKIVLTKKPKVNTPEIYYMKEEIKQIVNFKCYRNEKNKEKEVFLDSDVHDTCSALNILRVSGHIGNGR